MPNINPGYALFGLYRNHFHQGEEQDSHETCICQYTTLHQIGRDFNVFEISLHFMLRIYPAVKRRIIKYAKACKTVFIKTRQSNHASPGTDERQFLKKDLAGGDTVKIKSYPEIAATLNSKGKLKGLSFLTGMKPYCGEIATVEREPLYLPDHGGKKLQKCKNIVICKNLYCDGTNIRCDRACLYYWKKDWLKEVS